MLAPRHLKPRHAGQQTLPPPLLVQHQLRPTLKDHSLFSRAWKLNPLSPPEPSDEELLAAQPHPDSFRAVVKHLLAVGRLMGALPTSSFGAMPRSRCARMPVVFSCLVALAITARIGVDFYCVYKGAMTLFELVVTTRLGFSALALLECLLYTRLAFKWRPFVLCFLRVERRLGEDIVDPKLRRHLYFLTTILTSLAIGDVILQLSTFPLPQTEYDSISKKLEDYYKTVFLNVGRVVPYSPTSLIACWSSTTAINLILNFNDNFIILVCTVLYRRFKALSSRLSEAAQHTEDVQYWRSARETFNDLSQLTRDVDHFLNGLVLLSCLNNFFSVCIQLQLTVQSSALAVGNMRKLYYMFSFLLVLLRSATMVLSASAIPEETKVLKRILYSMPAEQYTDEIKRFLFQVTTDEVALTGLGLFTITRSFILTMLGTIATYEVLLVQMYRTSH